MKILKIITGVLTGVILAFTFFFGRHKIGSDYLDKTASAYQGVISVWQIDSFEGGTGSRRVFLMNTASNFEKQNKGTLFMVTNFTIDGAIDAIQQGRWPDIISYGSGLEPQGAIELRFDKNVKYGNIGDKNYAIPWCRGTYVLIVKDGAILPSDKTINEIIVSQGEYTQPLTALYLSGYSAKKVTKYAPQDAFSYFYNGKVQCMIGTQRDVVRLSYKNANATIIPLDSYNDLYQYISVTTKDSQKITACINFVNYLTSEGVQNRVKNLNLFSPYISLQYDSEEWNSMQNLTFAKGVSAFVDRLTLKEMQRLSTLAILGDSVAGDKLKNIVF